MMKTDNLSNQKATEQLLKALLRQEIKLEEMETVIWTILHSIFLLVEHQWYGKWIKKCKSEIS